MFFYYCLRSMPLFRMGYSRCLINILMDSPWLIIHIGTSALLGNVQESVINWNLILRLEIIPNLRDCLKRTNFDLLKGLKTLLFEYLFILSFTTLSITVVMILFLLIPNLTRILTSLLLILVVPFAIMSLLPTQLEIPAFCIAVGYFLYTLFTFSLSETKRISKDYSLFFELRPTLKAGFFVRILFSVSVILLKMCLLRFSNLRTNGPATILIILYFLASELFVTRHKARCSFFQCFVPQLVPTFRKMSSLELVPLFFTTILSGQLEAVNWVVSWLHPFFIYWNLQKRYPRLTQWIRNHPFKVQCAAACGVSYFSASRLVRSKNWEDSAKSSAIHHGPVTVLIPSILLTALLFIWLFGEYFRFFRDLELIMIVIAHYFVAIEMLTSIRGIIVLKATLSQITDIE